MRKRDKQRVFDKVAAHLLTQKKKSTVDETYNRCVYKTKGGLMCAAGVLLPQDITLPEDINTLGWTTLMYHTKDAEVNGYQIYKKLKKKIQKYLLEESAINFVKDLQIIHDQFHVNEWYDRLKSTAEIHDLDSSVLNQFKGD